MVANRIFRWNILWLWQSQWAKLGIFLGTARTEQCLRVVHEIQKQLKTIFHLKNFLS